MTMYNGEQMTMTAMWDVSLQRRLTRNLPTHRPACVWWLWLVGGHFLSALSKCYRMNDFTSYSRKQMALSNWAFGECFIEGTL